MNNYKQLAIRRTELDLSEDVRLDISPEVLKENTFMEIAQFDDVVNDITTTCAEVSEQCAEICAEISEVGGQIGSFVANSGIIKNRNKAALTGMGIELAANAGAALWNMYKQHKIQKEQKRKMQELLLKKQEIASVKLQWCREQLDDFSKKTKPVELYQKEFARKVVLDEQFVDKKVAGFKRSFALCIKWQYNIEVLQYLISEMKAWQNGEHTSGVNRPDWTRIVNSELSRWPCMLLSNCNIKPWQEYLNSVLFKEKTSLPVPIYLMLTEPFLLRNYIGVSVSEMEHCSVKAPLINFPQKEMLSSSAQKLLNTNPYYTDMVQIAEQMPDEAPTGAEPIDYLTIACCASCATVLFLVLDYYMEGFWFFLVGTIVAFLGGLITVAISSNVPSVNKCGKHAEALKHMQEQEKESAIRNNEIKIR